MHNQIFEIMNRYFKLSLKAAQDVHRIQKVEHYMNLKKDKRILKWFSD